MSSYNMKPGDVFAIPLPDKTFIFGRLMLDLYAVQKKRLLPAGSPLPMGPTFLIEMYRLVSSTMNFRPSEILIPGAFIQSEQVKEEWPIVAHVPILVEDVGFPESLIGYHHAHGDVAFQRGEMQFPLPLSLGTMFFDDPNCRYRSLQRLHSPSLWPYVCLAQLGRSAEIPKTYKTWNLARRSWDLAWTDLRFTAHRDELYQYLPIDPADTYYEQQRQLGLNLDRLYA